MPLGVLDGAVVSITEVRREVVVVEQVTLHHYLMHLHLQMVCSRLGTFLVVGVL